jgi:hypothetical protein
MEKKTEVLYGKFHLEKQPREKLAPEDYLKIEEVAEQICYKLGLLNDENELYHFEIKRRMIELVHHAEDLWQVDYDTSKNLYSITMNVNTTKYEAAERDGDVILCEIFDAYRKFRRYEDGKFLNKNKIKVSIPKYKPFENIVKFPDKKVEKKPDTMVSIDIENINDLFSLNARLSRDLSIMGLSNESFRELLKKKVWKVIPQTFSDTYQVELNTKISIVPKKIQDYLEKKYGLLRFVVNRKSINDRRELTLVEEPKK